MMRSHRLARRLLLASALLVILAGCENPFQPRVGTERAVATPPPRPTTPRKLMELIRWCWINRAVPEYEELFTDDFRFAFAAADSADNAPILRDEEIDIARRLFLEGTASAPRANRIEYEYGNQNLIPLPDSRPGKMSPWHQEVQAHVVLHVYFDDAARIDVETDVIFYLVRGDSALIPKVLKERGFGSDTNRWYIERWEERSSGAAAAAGAPAEPVSARWVGPGARARSTADVPGTVALGQVTWGRLMARYRVGPL
jgi:hypothetical protein